MVRDDPEAIGGLKGAEEETLAEAFALIKDWRPQSDVVALKYHMIATSLLSSGTAAYINSHYRRAVKLKHYAFIPTFLPVVLLPAVVSGVLHHQFVQRPLLLQKFQCPVCLELKGGMVQLFSGLVYPMVLAPLAAFQFAVRLYTYPLPSVTEPKEWFRGFYKMTRPILPRLYVLAGLQIIVGTAITHWEAHNLFTMMAKLSAMEEVVSRHRTEEHQ